MDAQKVANMARRSLSRYCMEECGSYCCRKGYLPLTKQEVVIVMQGKRTTYEQHMLLKELPNGNFSLFMGKNEFPCPSFQEGKCSIHKSRLRPNCCREFPLFLKEGIVMASSRCPAVRIGMLYPYIKRLTIMGYRYVKAEEMDGPDVFYSIGCSKGPKTECRSGT